MPKIILIKHASPVVTPGVPPEGWPLSEQGRLKCPVLADAIRGYEPAVVLSSIERKASQTAELVAEALGVSFRTAAGLHEHDRSNVPQLPSREFISLVELFFRRPGELVLGRESADEALSRFEAAVKDVLADHTGKNVAVVSHGTVIALLLARHGVGTGFELWRKMGLPSFAVLESSTMKIEKRVDLVS